MKKYLTIGILSISLVVTSLLAKNNDIKLVKKMCSTINTHYGINCPIQLFKQAIKNGCKTIISKKEPRAFNIEVVVSFDESDPYLNEGACYMFAANLLQRFDKKSGLFNGDKGIYLLNDLPNGRYREGESYLGVVKGNGMFQYKTVSGNNKTVSKGNVISITY